MLIDGYKKKRLNLFIWFLTIVVSILAIIIILFNISDHYRLLFLLPTGFLLLNSFTIFAIGRLYSSLPALIILASYFIRLVVTPVLFCLGGYNSLYNNVIPNEAIDNAIIFMIYEFSAVMFAMILIASRQKVKNSFPQKINIYRYNTKRVTLSICLLCLFLAFAYFYVPIISSIYKPILSTTLSETTTISWDNETIVARGSLERYIYSLFTFLWPVARLLLPSLIIAQIYKRYGVSKKSVFYSSFALFIPFFILSGDNIGPFISAIVAILIIQRLYEKKARPLFYIGSISIALALGVMVFAKIESFTAWRGADGVAVIAQIFNAYFPGFENVAITNMIVNNNKLGTLLFDLYYTIPFKETLFGLDGINLSDLFRLASATGGQIIPFNAQIAHYITYIGAPFVTALFVALAMKYEKKAKDSENYWQVFLYTYIFVLTAMSINNYSFMIYLRSLVNIVLPIKAVMVVARYKTKKKNCRHAIYSMSTIKREIYEQI